MKGGKEWALVPLVLALASALLVLPIWLQGGTQGHDLFHHLLSGHYFARQLWQGELYPRWLMAMNGGFGSPTFFFYPPLPYYVSALFAGPGAHPQQAIYPLLGSATLALLLSGVFAYLWLRATTPPGRALAASLLYLALPYHVAMDLYARFALAEFWAFAWAPLILLGQDLAHRGRPQGLPLLILGLALLALLTLLFGVRPLAQRFGRRERVVNEAEPLEQDLLTDATTEKEETLSALPNIGFNTNDDMLPPQSSGLETKVEYLQVLAQNETERVAEVLKQWINSNDRSNRKQD